MSFAVAPVTWDPSDLTPFFDEEKEFSWEDKVMSTNNGGYRRPEKNRKNSKNIDLLCFVPEGVNQFPL